MSAVNFHQVVKQFQDSSRAVFTDFSLTIEPYEVVCLLGPSGCGKSTLLRMMAGFEKPSQGQVEVNSEYHGKIGFVFQEPLLLPWRTLQGNVQLPLEIKGVVKGQSRVLGLAGSGSWGNNEHPTLRNILEMVGLYEYRRYFPSQLSGGMKMRTSIARALIDDVKLVLMDEPFAALDEPTRLDLQVEFLRIHRQRRLTTVFVTHSLSEAAFIADRVIFLNKEGRLVGDVKLEGASEKDSSYRASDQYFKNLKDITVFFQQKAGR